MTALSQRSPDPLSGSQIPESMSKTFPPFVYSDTIGFVDALNNDSRTTPSFATKTTGTFSIPALGNAPDGPLPPIPIDSSRGKRKKKAGKRGPRPVQWTPSKERQFARLQQMTTVNIKDIPVVMRDDELKFE